MNNKPNSPNIFVTNLDLALSKKLLQDLKDQDFEISKPQYTVFQAKKKGISCTLYESGKLTVQGKEMQSFIEFYLEPEILKNFGFTYQNLDINTESRIGIDESGKGDFFGPLCIAGVFAGGEDVLKLKSLGVKDSKTISDPNIIKIGREIKKHYAHHVVRINPAKYNELYTQFKNLNSLLAWGHATTIEQLVLKTDCRHVVVDQFAAEWVVKTALKRKNIELKLEQKHRAEEELVVAAASILARQAFLEGMEKMSEQYGLEFPKGASAKTVAVGKKFVSKYGQEALHQVGKMHFKTSGIILNQSSSEGGYE